MSIAKPVGGRLWTPLTKLLLVLSVISGAIIVYRFVVGLGPVTNLNDGVPWGLWIAWDVVIGTALACGGYAVALMVYVFNKGRYHPLVRPALVTSLLGYSMGVFGVLLDVGRPWLAWKIPVRVDLWNYDSVLFEVALCIGAYLLVLILEASPIFLEKMTEKESPWTGAARSALGLINKVMPFLIALGLLLPTMHQSSLGGLLVIAGSKVHPLWHTGMLPLLFLISVLGMGWSVLVVESSLSSRNFGRPYETQLLAKLFVGLAIAQVAFVVVRFVDLGVNGRLGLTVSSGGLSVAFWAEILLFVVPVLVLASPKRRTNPATLFQMAMLILAGGALYRLDAFTVAYNPGSRWHYFPSAPEVLVTVGIIAFEILVYVVLVRRFNVLPAVGRSALGEQHG